jgi:hypothetical protein
MAILIEQYLLNIFKQKALFILSHTAGIQNRVYIKTIFRRRITTQNEKKLNKNVRRWFIAPNRVVCGQIPGKKLIFRQETACFVMPLPEIRYTGSRAPSGHGHAA